MRARYARWIRTWERRLLSRDTNRRALPFDWGLDWLYLDGLIREPEMEHLTAESLASALDPASIDTTEFFGYRKPSHFDRADGEISFESPVSCPHPENRTGHARFFEAPRNRGRAVVVVPQWNAALGSHVGLCRLLNRFGISALRLTKPYHDRRRPASLQRADFHVSSNLGRTIHAMRQAVIDTRCCLDWLESQGYDRLGIVGTSLGSCVAFIAAAHDTRVRTGAFNHVSAYFGDVVWTGLATRHVRQGLEEHLSQTELRRIWAVISPAPYIDRFRLREFRSLLIWARHDPVFLPAYSRSLLASYRGTEVVCLPCGHYTLGEFPFNLIDGIKIVRFLVNQL